MKINRPFGSLSLTVLVIVPLVGFLTLIGAPTARSIASAHISVWWPVSNVLVGGVQPFKALVDNMPVEAYKMFWRVGDGQLNSMENNYVDYPHKEALVNVDNWTWESSGVYNVSLIAKDTSGNIIAEEVVPVLANVNRVVEANISSPSPLPLSPATLPSSNNVAVSNSLSVASIPAGSSLSPLSPIAKPSGVVSVLWPQNGSTVSGLDTYMAVLDGTKLTDYRMYWSVDYDRLNTMYDNGSGANYKEADVDVSSWNWRGSGPYVLSFIAKNNDGQEIARTNITITVGTSAVTTPRPTAKAIATPVPTPLPTPFVNATPLVFPSSDYSLTNSLIAPVSTPIAIRRVTTSIKTTDKNNVNKNDSTVSNTNSTMGVSTAKNNPLSGANLYIDSNSNALRQAESWKNSRPEDATAMMKIANSSQAKWFGDWNSDIYGDVKNFVDAANNKGETPVMIAYNIPIRDCGNYSAGGSNNATGYETWINSLAKGIGSKKAVVILEPDALTLIGCLSPADVATRNDLLKNAVHTLKSLGNTIVYIDAGHSNWVGAEDMSSRLKSAGISEADGFALNVSNYYTNSEITNYGDKLSSLLGNKHYVVDTSRNGSGANGEWCNPGGRSLGTRPTTTTLNSAVDAFLWLKSPGESDGTCNGGPSAGVWWPEYALGLAQRAGY